MTVAENVAYGLTVRRRPRAEIKARVDAALATVELGGFGDRAIQQLSGGQQQRVALARALVIEPDVLLMDEPLGALDRQLRRNVQLELRRLHEERRRTTLYVTHDQEEALILSDRVAVMRAGRIEQLGPVADLYNNPANSFVASFIGHTNILRGRIDDSAGTVALDGGGTLRCRTEGEVGPDVAISIRPEDIALAKKAAPANGDGMNVLPGVVTSATVAVSA